VEAAFEVFAAKGYNGGSLQNVADRVGLSQTSLLHYFPTKRDLLLAVLSRRDEIGRPDLGDDLDFPEGLVEQARINEGRPGLLELYTVLCGESVTEDHPARVYFTRRFLRLRDDYAQDLRRLAASGRLRRGVDPERAATSIIALWDGLQTQWLLTKDVDIVGCLRDYLDTIILPAPARPRRDDAMA
jgi:AcrR family transcriptional regulator